MIDLIMWVIFITLTLIIIFKLFQKLCLWFVWDYQFKDENSRLCKLSQKYTHILFGIGIGRFPRKGK